jgi:capsular exopolysaccharide synthesis family protein
LAFVIEYLDNTVKAPEDLEPLKIGSLGLVPIIEGLNGRFLELDSLYSVEDRKNKALSPSGVLPPGQWQARESFYGLATAILLSTAEKPPQKVLVTSATPQDGKTTTVAYLGATLADMGASTVIVDADLRKPSLGKFFGIEADWGLSNFLAGHAGLRTDYVHKTSVPGLSILPAGPKTPNPLALLSSDRFRDLLDALSKVFNFVLVDSSPILTVADTRMLVSSVEGVVIVIQANKTPREIVKRARQELEQSGASILGGVINRADLKQPQYAYYNQYYYSEGYSTVPAGRAT